MVFRICGVVFGICTRGCGLEFEFVVFKIRLCGLVFGVWGLGERCGVWSLSLSNFGGWELGLHTQSS